MSTTIFTLLIPLLVNLLKKGISSIVSVRLLSRPDINDKAGTRAWLDNTLGWLLYLHGMFLSDLRTAAFVLANLRDIVKDDTKWDALYAALLHDFVTTPQLMPELVETSLLQDDTSTAAPNALLDQFCTTLKPAAANIGVLHGIFSDQAAPVITDEDRSIALQYITFSLNLLDQPGIARSHEALYTNK
jgi:hypothetical protein